MDIYSYKLTRRPLLCAGGDLEAHRGAARAAAALALGQEAEPHLPAGQAAAARVSPTT